MKQYKTETVKRSDIKPYPKNPRKIEDKNLKALENSMEEFGVVEQLVWNEKTGHLCGGHQRLKILDKHKVDRVECTVVNIDEEKEKALIIALNSKTLTGDWEQEMLEELLNEIEQENELIFDELLLEELRETEIILGDDKDNNPIEFENYYVMIKCESESEQKELIERFNAEGLNVEARQI